MCFRFSCVCFFVVRAGKGTLVAWLGWLFVFGSGLSASVGSLIGPGLALFRQCKALIGLFLLCLSRLGFVGCSVFVSIGHSFPPRRCRPIKILKQTKKKEEKLRRNLVHGVRCGITVSAATAGSTQDQRRTRNLVCTESSWKGVGYYCLVFRCLPQEQNTTRTDCRENEIHG